jgi:hypothetical protein
MGGAIRPVGAEPDEAVKDLVLGIEGVEDLVARLPAEPGGPEVARLREVVEPGEAEIAQVGQEERPGGRVAARVRASRFSFCSASGRKVTVRQSWRRTSKTAWSLPGKSRASFSGAARRGGRERRTWSRVEQSRATTSVAKGAREGAAAGGARSPSTCVTWAKRVSRGARPPRSKAV